MTIPDQYQEICPICAADIDVVISDRLWRMGISKWLLGGMSARGEGYNVQQPENRGGRGMVQRKRGHEFELIVYLAMSKKTGNKPYILFTGRMLLHF